MELTAVENPAITLRVSRLGISTRNPYGITVDAGDTVSLTAKLIASYFDHVAGHAAVRDDVSWLHFRRVLARYLR